MTNRAGLGLHVSRFLEMARVAGLTNNEETQNFRFFHALFKNLWDKQTKNYVFVVFQSCKN